MLKPSEQTPLTTLKLAKIAAEILPEGVLNVVVGRGDTVGNALINHPQGGDDLAHRLDRAPARRCWPPRRSRSSAPISSSAARRRSSSSTMPTSTPWSQGVRVFGYYNAGQDCTAACRIYAGAKVYDKLVADLSSAVSTIAYDLPDDTKNEIGPLISARQRERVAGFVERARDNKHVEITTGGKHRPRRRLLLPADGGRRRAAGRRDRAQRGLRAGGLGHALRRRRRRRSPGRTIPTTAWPRRCGRRTSARRWRSPRACNTAAPGSTATSC